MKLTTIQPRFVEFIPRELEEGVLYISESHRIAVHKCASGCGEKVVTPLSPVEWQLRKEGDLVSLNPSIGNWNYDCRSHYWISRNRIVWAGALSESEIAYVQARDRADKERYIAAVNMRKAESSGDRNQAPTATGASWWVRLVSWFRALVSAISGRN